MYSSVLIIHICAGAIGLLAGFVAMVVRKGAGLHRSAGMLFGISMLVMAAVGGYIALRTGQRLNILAGTFTFYLVATGWLTVRRGPNVTGRFEFGLLLVAIAAAVSGWVFAWQTASTGLKAGYSVFASVLMVSAAGDVRMLIRGGVSGAQRLARHLWRMGVALFIAAASFFLGSSGDPVLRRAGLRATLFSPAVRKTHLPEVPVIIVVLLTLFWLYRVLFTNKYKQPLR